MKADLVIRELKQADLSPLMALYKHLHDDDEAAPGGQLEKVWNAILRDSSQIYLGGFVDGVLVSACNAAVIPNLTRGARPYAVIENVVTHADHRRRGIGKKVMLELLKRCWARGCYKTMLMSAMRSLEIHGFYESLGFDKRSKQAFVIKCPSNLKETL